MNKLKKCITKNASFDPIHLISNYCSKQFWTVSPKIPWKENTMDKKGVQIYIHLKKKSKFKKPIMS